MQLHIPFISPDVESKLHGGEHITVSWVWHIDHISLLRSAGFKLYQALTNEYVLIFHSSGKRQWISISLYLDISPWQIQNLTVSSFKHGAHMLAVG